MSGSPATTPRGGEATAASSPVQRKQSAAMPGRKEVKDFKVGRVLGEGAYARVFIVRAKDTGKDFAMKVMEKKFIVKEGKSKEVQMERRVLSEVSHPFIVRLFFSFHDKDRLYMILDLCPNGELAKLVRYSRDNRLLGSNRALSEDQARFYLAETISAVQHLHSIGILHRDIKPENVLIASSGHVKLTDFGTAKDLKAASSQPADPITGKPRKDTFCGTAEYVSPEVLQDEPADIGADLWALGIMLHAMLVGKTPFLAESEFLTFQCILTYAGIQDKETDALLSEGEDGGVQLPKKTPETLAFAESDKTSLSTEALDLVKKLLDPTPDKRLGRFTPDDLRRHPWFRGMDFTTLEQLTPPALPYSCEYEAPALDGAGNDWLVSDEGGAGADDDEEEEMMLRMSRGSASSSKKSASSPKSPRTPLQSEPSAGLEKYLHKDEKVLLDGAVSVASYGGFVNSRRHMVLTDKGRIILIDPNSFTVKDELVAINASVAIKPNGKDFDLITSKRTLRLRDLLGSAERWRDALAKI